MRTKYDSFKIECRTKSACFLKMMQGIQAESPSLIRNCRKSLNMNQRDFAHEIGITNVHLSNLENGKVIVTLSVLRSLAEAMERLA